MDVVRHDLEIAAIRRLTIDHNRLVASLEHMHPPAEAAIRLIYQICPRLAARMVVEDILTTAPTCHDVVERSCRLISQRSCHEPFQFNTESCCQWLLFKTTPKVLRLLFRIALKASPTPLADLAQWLS